MVSVILLTVIYQNVTDKIHPRVREDISVIVFYSISDSYIQLQLDISLIAFFLNKVTYIKQF